MITFSARAMFHRKNLCIIWLSFQYLAVHVSDASRVTRLGEISPFGQFFMALGEFFSRKNSPMIWAKF